MLNFFSAARYLAARVYQVNTGLLSAWAGKKVQSYLAVVRPVAPAPMMATRWMEKTEDAGIDEDMDTCMPTQGITGEEDRPLRLDDKTRR